jgi:hypothetical protein|tara:strand:+ start:109 stop:270 length:162 start_codon:yes stop_codon:yes gene_type:complete
METWKIIGIVAFVLAWAWIFYEVRNAPLMPDDFDLREEDIWPEIERPCNDEEE